MRKKQLGAAPEDRPAAVDNVNRAGRLRAQPGFRTAAVAFVLTVVLGIGGTAAYAYWSQSSSGSITGTTARPALPALQGNPRCYLNWNVYISQPRPVSARPADAAAILKIEAVHAQGNQTFLYRLNTVKDVNLPTLPRFEDKLRSKTTLKVSMATAYLDPAKVPAGGGEFIEIPQGAILDQPKFYETTAYWNGTFACNKWW